MTYSNDDRSLVTVKYQVLLALSYRLHAHYLCLTYMHCMQLVMKLLIVCWYLGNTNVNIHLFVLAVHIKMPDVAADSMHIRDIATKRSKMGGMDWYTAANCHGIVHF